MITGLLSEQARVQACQREGRQNASEDQDGGPTRKYPGAVCGDPIQQTTKIGAEQPDHKENKKCRA